MSPGIETVFYFLLLRIMQVDSINQVLYFQRNCSGAYKLHHVSSTQTYDLVFRGNKPPKSCTHGFYQGSDGKVCVDVVSFNVQDCDIKISFSLDYLKIYSCSTPPIQTLCADYGRYFDIRLTTRDPRKKEYEYSSLTLHITPGEVRDSEPRSNIDIAAILWAVGSGLFIFIVLFCGIKYARYKAKQQFPSTMSDNMTSTSQVPIHHRVSQQQNTRERTRTPNPHPRAQRYATGSVQDNRQTAQTQRYNQQPRVQGHGTASVHSNRPSSQTHCYGQTVPEGHGHGQPQAHGQLPVGYEQGLISTPERGQAQAHDNNGEENRLSYDPSAPPPSYEEAQKYKF